MACQKHFAHIPKPKREGGGSTLYAFPSFYTLY
jgi:hypothetical protein